MPRDTKWKFAILAGISECLVFAEAKYCAFEIHGDVKYYVCPRTEYCCNFGCCVSPGFQIYHLWYYWLLLIIMFLVCSGGRWWYRYWLQGRYRAGAPNMPHRPYTSRAQNSLRGSSCQTQQARISYNTARNTVLLHRMWKGPHRDANSPAYNNTAASSTHYQSTSVVLSDTDCPYYQLYGPPPSYETVIAQTRGKFSTPMSPEQSRMMLQNPTPNQCFAHPYIPPPRINDNPDGPCRRPSAVGSTIRPAVASGHLQCSSHFIPAGDPPRPDAICPNLCSVIGTEGNFRVYKESLRKVDAFDADKSCDVENVQQGESSSPESHGIAGIDCASGSKITNEKSSRSSKLAEESISKVHGWSNFAFTRPPRSRSSQNLEKDKDRTNQGGSLLPHRVIGKKSICFRFYDVVSGDPKSSIHPAPQAVNGKATSSDVASSNASSSQSNPSNNVILAPPTSNVVIDMSAASNNANDADERRLLLSATQGSTNSNLESNCKLDRSRSLD